MIQAYSRLKRVLGAQQLTIPELHRRIKKHGMNVNLKSLYRLNHENQPVERLDLRVAGAICQVCNVPLSELISFDTPKRKLQRFSASKQRRLDILMAKNNEGQLTATEREELEGLVYEAEEMMLTNSRMLVEQSQQLATG